MSTVKYIKGLLPGVEGEHDIAILEGDPCAGRWVEEAHRIDHDQWILSRIGEFIKPESVVYDVGAYIGDHTAYYASKAAMVVAFEPMLDAFKALEFNTRMYDNVVKMNCPLGNGEHVDLVRDDGSTGNNFGARFLARKEDGIGVTRLDSLSVVLLAPPSLMKLDVEGWEVNVLLGAEQTIRRHRPIIVSEVNSGALNRAGTSPRELYDLLVGFGYNMRDLVTKDAWDPDDNRPQFDIVATWVADD